MQPSKILAAAMNALRYKYMGLYRIGCMRIEAIVKPLD